MKKTKIGGFETEDYDGVRDTRIGNARSISYDIEEALDQDNPRNVFLNGQLYTEMSCDLIITLYFSKDDSLKSSILDDFLTSKSIDFFGKINLMRMLLKKTEVENRYEILIPLEIIQTLHAVAEIRNAFHHHLVYTEAMKQVQMGGKFSVGVKKQLKSYHKIEDLTNDFKVVVKILNEELNNVISSI
ncbi:hypothetical protein HYT57_02050 [Candidatus Woesearchaeota archaeon]|nr:hypothetical protein [Candidatus Woesearchaeota archaeon]